MLWPSILDFRLAWWEIFPLRRDVCAISLIPSRKVLPQGQLIALSDFSRRPGTYQLSSQDADTSRSVLDIDCRYMYRCAKKFISRIQSHQYFLACSGLGITCRFLQRHLSHAATLTHHQLTLLHHQSIHHLLSSNNHTWYFLSSWYLMARILLLVPFI